MFHAHQLIYRSVSSTQRQHFSLFHDIPALRVSINALPTYSNALVHVLHSMDCCGKKPAINQPIIMGKREEQQVGMSQSIIQGNGA